MPTSTSANIHAMSGSFEKSVKGGTKVKCAPPKSKYVEHILLATQSGEAGVAEVFRTLTHRLRDSTWTVAFKALIIVHLMIKEGVADVTLRYLSVAPRNRLAINSFTDVQTQGQNIRVYSEYLLARAQAFEMGHCDYVRNGERHMKRLSVDKGLLRETELVQDQIKALVRCDLLSNDYDSNEISLTAFRLLTRDLLNLFDVENQAVMSVLSHYFEMSRPDAERAITIYKTFCKQTDQVVQYLSVARQYEYATRLEIPKLKHAPTSLAASLQEYLDDKDFEVNRRQYLAEQEAKKSGKPFSKPSQPAVSSTKTPTPFDEKPTTQPAAATASAKGPNTNLIDFFESIEQNQQTTETNPFLRQPQQPQPTGFQQPQPTGFQQPQSTGFQQPQSTGFQQPQTTGFQQPQQTGFAPEQQAVNGFGLNGAPTNPYAQSLMQQQPPPQPLQAQYTGAGFGGYGPQPSQQSFAPGNDFGQQAQQFQTPAQTHAPAQLQPQPTNPFRQSMMAIGGSGGFGSLGQPQQQQQHQQQQQQQQSLQRSATNPFARNQISSIPEGGPPPQQLPPQTSSPFSQQQPSFQTQQQPLQAQLTGTNPFARNQTPTQQPTPPVSPPNALQVQPTGSTNPFRQSMFVNQQTGQGWQNSPQATMGGLENLQTVPIFPRPGQAPQQQQQSPWG
ncbi:ENTH domain-containing [Lecanosticta acicola]|uniref:ENTH domain-containing n=1 Tax=Lecanosticta acicola TaxID=111012 RepID=A0AAI8Z2V4_9PEZI|nr:ENTH domain-containing [Lecanosticta acicola]